MKFTVPTFKAVQEMAVMCGNKKILLALCSEIIKPKFV